MKKLIRSFNTEFEQNGEDLAIIDTTQRAAKPIMIDSHVLDEAIKNGDHDALSMISIDVNNQELTVTPSTEKQTFIPDTNYTGFSPVVVEAAPLEDLNSEMYTYNNELTEQETTVEELTELLKTKGISEPPKYKPRWGRVIFENYTGTELDYEIENLDISNITSMERMFLNCTNLTNVDVSKWDTSNVTNMNSTFNGCKKIKRLDVSKWDTSNVTNMAYLFSNCSALTELDLSNFDTSKVTDISQMLSSLKITEFNVNHFDTSNVTRMYYTFGSNNSNLVDLDISNWDASKVNYIYDCFGYLFNLTNLKFMRNLGKAYKQSSSNYYDYRLSVGSSTKLTHDSLMSIINNVYDLNLSYNTENGGTLYTQQLEIGNTNLAKLTAEEIAIATAKGWTVS